MNLPLYMYVHVKLISIPTCYERHLEILLTFSTRIYYSIVQVTASHCYVF